MDIFKYIFILCLSFLAQDFAAQTFSKIHLTSGGVKTGQVILMSENYLLLKQKSELLKIERDSILFQISNTSIDIGGRRKSPRMDLNPIGKRFLNELDAGLTFGMPFALRIGYTKWLRISDHWHLGLGTSMQFYRYTMLNGNLNIRWLLGQDRFVKPFFEGGFGLSYLAYVNGLNFRSQTGVSLFPPGYKSEISTVKQATIGPGLYMDTGLGVAFTSRLVYNATWYNQVEYPTPTFFIRGEYFFSSASLIFSFIF